MESKLMPCPREKEIDHEYTSEIVCPYCGYEHSDSWEWEQDELEPSEDYECKDCGRTFIAERNVTVRYSTYPKKDEVIADDHKRADHG